MAAASIKNAIQTGLFGAFIGLALFIAITFVQIYRKYMQGVGISTPELTAANPRLLMASAQLRMFFSGEKAKYRELILKLEKYTGGHCEDEADYYDITSRVRDHKPRLLAKKRPMLHNMIFNFVVKRPWSVRRDDFLTILASSFRGSAIAFCQED